LPNLESVSIASSRTYHPFTGADQAATAQVRAMVEPNKGKLRSVAARPVFDDIIRHTAPPEGVNFREGAVGGVSAWWAEPEGAATGCEHLRFSARPPLGCRALLSAPIATKSPPPACPAVPPRSAVLPSIVPSGGSALMFQRNSFYARGGTVSAIRQKCALLISKKEFRPSANSPVSTAIDRLIFRNLRNRGLISLVERDRQPGTMQRPATGSAVFRRPR